MVYLQTYRHIVNIYIYRCRDAGVPNFLLFEKVKLPEFTTVSTSGVRPPALQLLALYPFFDHRIVQFWLIGMTG